MTEKKDINIYEDIVKTREMIEKVKTPETIQYEIQQIKDTLNGDIKISPQVQEILIGDEGFKEWVKEMISETKTEGEQMEFDITTEEEIIQYAIERRRQKQSLYKRSLAISAGILFILLVNYLGHLLG